MFPIPAFGQAIGLELTGVEGRNVHLKVPYSEHLVGDPDTGVIHGGVITAGGVSSSLELGLYLCEKWAGVEAKNRIQDKMDFQCS